MRITVRYMAQVRRAAGVSSEQVEAAEACAVREFVRQIAARHGEPLRQLLVDEAGLPQPAILLFVGDVHIAAGEDAPLRDGDTVTLLSPISGG